MAVGMGQEQNGLLGMINDTIGKARLVVRYQGHAIFAGNVPRRDDDEFVPRDLGAESDSRDLSARNAAAHGCAVEHSGESDVIDILRTTGDLVPPFFPWDRHPDTVLNHHVILFSTRNRTPPSH